MTIRVLKINITMNPFPGLLVMLRPCTLPCQMTLSPRLRTLEGCFSWIALRVDRLRLAMASCPGQMVLLWSSTKPRQMPLFPGFNRPLVLAPTLSPSLSWFSRTTLKCSNTFGALNDVVDDDQHVSCLDDNNEEGVDDAIVQPLPIPGSHDINKPDINDCITPEARNEDHFLGELETKETGCTTKVRSESLANLTMPLGRNNIIIGCRNDISSTNGIPEEANRSLSMSEKLVQYPKIIPATLDKTNSFTSGAASEISSTSQCMFPPHPTYSCSTINKLLKGC
ncbi:hypothetical protein Nepgr_026018 [Nepenthes gracilis]|uniref:Uncharacterized protein n=1 Tax=Nepenthes gracilis TaxID=150966 RepID=A0AAD3T744_NEPGR|nr:hypothetical protein Nepgr_026018 [Nepenthes gracilis]